MVGAFSASSQITKRAFNCLLARALLSRQIYADGHVQKKKKQDKGNSPCIA